MYVPVSVLIFVSLHTEAVGSRMDTGAEGCGLLIQPFSKLYISILWQLSLGQDTLKEISGIFFFCSGFLNMLP